MTIAGCFGYRCNFRARLPVAAAFLLLAAAGPPPERNTGDVFRNFEAICLTDMANGYSLDVKLLIEKADFEFQRSNRGFDIYNSYLGQLIISDRSCSMGMPDLPFETMLGLTTRWAERRGFITATPSPSTSGGQRLEWKNGANGLALEENHFPDGTPLTGLIMWKE